MTKTQMNNSEIYMLNPQDLPIGSVTYYIKKHGFDRWEIDYGLVEMHYPHNIVLTMLDVNRTGRSIEGVPYNDFTATEWRKLPKGWRYDTRLFEIKWDGAKELEEKWKAIDVTNPDSILDAYNNRVLIKVENNDYGIIDSEVDSKRGYRIVKRYQMWAEPHPWNKSFLWNEVYKDYSAAKAILDKREKDLKRISEMDDREYSIYMFTQTIDSAVDLPETYREDCKKYLMAQDNIEDIVVRRGQGGIQWKYDRNKRWILIGHVAGRGER